MSLARACHYEDFPRWIRREREHLFQSIALFSVEVRPVSKNCSCSWSARAPRLPLFARAFVSARRSIQPSTLLYGFFFFWVGGGQSATHRSILNSLRRTLAAQETLKAWWVWMGEWVWTHQNLWHYGLLLHFSAGIHFPSQHTAAEVLCYLRIFDWCIKQIITQLS